MVAGRDFTGLFRDRPDYSIIADWIRSGSRVLDLGCGDGALLAYLAEMKGVSGYGIELDDRHIAAGIRAGINVIQKDLNEGLSDFDDDSFDYVVLSLTLQAIGHPGQLVREILRVGQQGIVSFPNFGHWRSRMYLAFRGRMPVTLALPSSWYNTPNIHLCTMRDFDGLCTEQNIRIIERCSVDHAKRSRLLNNLMPNLFGEVALYHFARQAR